MPEHKLGRQIEDEKVRLRAIVYVDYEADPKHYGTNDPVKMAALDTDNFKAEGGNLGVFFDDDQLEIVVMPRRADASNAA